MDPITEINGFTAPTAANGSLESTATDAFGLGFEDLLRIVLTQLTYQDPLKPIENFEFVSQLAQFTQIQQTQTMSERMLGVLQTEVTTQATSLLGRTVDIPSGSVTISGKVTSVTFQDGAPRLTIETNDGRTISNIGLASVARITEGS